MSFSRSFTFHVSGSVHYPASERGGSVSYSDSVHVVVDVDTSDFDRSVRRCASQVGSLSNAVSSTAVGLVREKAESARKIARTMVSGFYKYIMYGVREKIMQLGAKIPMMMQALKSLAGHCTKTRCQLEADYQQITSRYADIFTDLEVNLKSALIGLDEPVYAMTNLANSVIMQNAMNIATSQVVVSGPEQMEAVNSVEVARIKQATEKVVSEGARNIMYNVKLGSQIEHMLKDCPIRDRHYICMPVFKVSADDLESNQGAKDEFFFSGAFPVSSSAGLQAYLSRQADSDMFVDCMENPEPARSIDQFFRGRLSAFLADEPDAEKRERLTAEIMRMWSSNFNVEELNKKE